MIESIKLAYCRKKQKIIHVDKAENGLGCDCICVWCKEELEARQGQIRDWHFKHHKNIECKGGQETALHQLGKQILVENSNKLPIAIPEYGTIVYSDAIAEKEFFSIRPDVSAIFDGQKIYFEIAVKHFVESDKEAFFIKEQHKSVEIDLSEVFINSFEEIKNIIFNKTENKRVIYWERKEEHNNYFSWFNKIAMAVLGFFALREVFIFFTGRRRK